MFGFNWLDVLIIGLLALAAWRGLRTNFWSQLLTILGFFAGLFIFGWVSTHVLKPHIDPAYFAVVNANIVLMVSFFFAIVGNTLGYRVHILLSEGKTRKIQQGLSVVFSVASVLVAVWLVAATIGRLPFEGLSNSANDALIVQALDRGLPSPPVFYSMLDRYVYPNNPPKVFVISESTPKIVSPQQVLDIAHAKKVAGNSTVRITSFGCGGIVSGSGFVLAPELVVTNAHVIAGVHRPIVKHENDSYEAVPIYFDSQLDIAILRVKNLKVAPLVLDVEDIDSNSQVVALGYPGGNFSAKPGVIAERIIAYGRNIYDIGLVDRDIYAVHMDIEPGSSGGPMLLPDGRVVGMIFARSDVAPNYGYALTSESVSLSLMQVINSTSRVGTGVCTAD